MQRSPACSIRHIHIAEQWYEGFSAADSLIGCGNVKRRLPVLVSGIYVCRVFEQNLDSLLQQDHLLHITYAGITCGFVKECAAVCVIQTEECSPTSLQEATARCRGVSHLLSLAFTLAPTNKRTLAVSLFKVKGLHDI